MKKYFKTQIKKSISLMLAVLMLLSCWVWVAPEKAAAANLENGEYQVRMVVDITDNGSCTGMSVTVYSDNGNATMTCSTDAMTNYGNVTRHVVATCDTVPGFPKGFDLSFTIDKCGDRGIGTYQNFTLQVYNNTNGGWEDLNSNDCGLTFTGAEGTKTESYSGGSTKAATLAENYPVATSIGKISDISLTIPKYGASNVTSSSAVSAGIYDQYGVRLTGKTPDSYFVSDSATGTAYTLADKGIAINSAKKVEVSSLAQEKIPGDTSTKKNTVYVFGKYKVDDSTTITSTLTSAAAVNLTYQDYTLTVSPDGSISGLGASMSMSTGGTQTGNWTNTGIVGKNPDGAYPTGGTDEETGAKLGATATGYTFKGFWTTKQPTEGYASYNAYESEFATPVSSTDFVNKYGGTEGGTYVTKDGKQYYNAGKEWTVDARTVSGEVTYYGWWVSTDIPVKFYDIDGKYIGTKTFKYGMEPAATEYLDPTEEYNAGAYTYKTFSGTWMDITGTKVTEGSYTFGTDGLLSLTLTPTYATKEYKSQYTVNFINPTSGGNLTGSGAYDYRYILGSEIPSTVTIPSTLANAWDYSYEFAGWSALAPSNGKYHVIAENDDVFELNEDWTVREDITYYPVLRSTVKEYIVDFVYTDTTGTTVTVTEHIPYGSAITTPDYVNRTYASEGMGYNLEGWSYVKADRTTATFDADNALVFNSDNVYLARNNYVGYTGSAAKAAIKITADYDDGTPMPYDVIFKYKSATGEDLKISAEVNHGENITQDTVDKLDVSATYDDGTALYTFANKWKVTEGTADKDEYTKEELTSFSPTSHVTFEAVYGEGVPFHNVTYIDGQKAYSERILEGENVPAWMVDSGEDDENGEDIMEVYVPEDYESDTGTYKFAGWYNEKQTDENYKATNGTKYTTASIVEGDLTLYAQYVFEPFKFLIEFYDYTGKVQLAAGEYEVGQNFGMIFAEANRAAQYRAPDETYTYEFIGWDQPYNEDNLVCEGKAVKYIAQYKPSYIYYDAHWYNDIDAMNADADPLTTTHHTYNSKVYNPSVTLTAPTASAGKSYVFAGWKYKDANGEPQAFVRGMAITAEMKFYATYAEVTEAHTVTTVVNGVEAEYKVKNGDTAEVVPTPVDMYADETNHKNFAGWYTSANYAEGTEFAIDTATITASIKIYAKYDSEAHNKDQKTINSVPTYYAMGSETIWCACNKEATKEDVDIAKLTDKVAPTGTIYLGDQGSWSSEGEPAYNTDGNPVALYANEDTDVIITANDAGNIDEAYNPSGVGIGIKNIKAFAYPAKYTLTGDNYLDALKVAVTVFEDTSDTQNNTANYVIKLGEVKVAEFDEDGKAVTDENGNVVSQTLQDGETYIIYYYVTDKAGNQLNRKVRTAKFIYDTTAPKFEITGAGNADTKTYCSAATVEEIEEGATVTVNDTVVTATYADGAETGTYKITTAGNQVITVTDKAGNKTTKKVKIIDGHTIVKSESAVTCEADGYYKETCAVCNATIKNEVTKTEGHKWVDGEPIAATCTENAATVKTCSVCGEKVVTEEEDSALDHDYAKDTDGNIIYTVVTAATCKEAGKKIANCTRCGGETITVIIPVDAEAHSWGGIKTQKATCTLDGKTYKTCKYCYTVEDVDVLEKTGHKETYTVVTKAATCGEKGTETVKCKKCDTVTATNEIPATGKHIAYETDRKAPTATEKGYIKYACKTCTTWTKTEEIDTLELYTVKFVNEDGTEIVTLEDQVVNTTITADDVTEPTKDSDNTYSYAFAGWVDANNNTVKLPFDVTADIILKATFKATTIIYTHKFMVPTKWMTTLSTSDDTNIEYAEVMGKYGDLNKKPVGTPTFKDADANTDAELKKLYTITFDYWATSSGVKVEDFTMKGDETFYAVFKAEPIEYTVTFLNKGSSYLWNTVVEGGEFVTYGGAAPVYSYDKEYHYTFNGWLNGATKVAEDVDATLGPITVDTVYVASYAATAHSYDTVVSDSDKTWAATCDEAGQTTKKCTCGAEKVVEIISALGHSYELQADGSKVCSVCGDTIAPEVKEVTITFNEAVVYENKDGEVIKTETKALKVVSVAEGGEYTYTAKKDNTAEYAFEFKGWTVSDGTVAAEAEIKGVANAGNLTYTANYIATVRKYDVIYADSDLKVVQTNTLYYGEDIPAAPATPVKASTETDHYEFIGWKVIKGVIPTDNKVTGEIVIQTEYKAETHNYVQTDEKVDDSCETAAAYIWKCDGCDKTITKNTGKPAGHKWTTETKAPSYTESGYVKKTCTVCGKTEESALPVLKYKTIKVTVKVGDQLINNAKVVLFVNESDGTVTEVGANRTNESGVVEFKNLEAGSYTVQVTEAAGANESSKEIKVTVKTNDEKVDAGVSFEAETVSSCSCSCHKDNFWGIIFRFFHKIISFFTGRVSCCSDPRT